MLTIPKISSWFYQSFLESPVSRVTKSVFALWESVHQGALQVFQACSHIAHASIRLKDHICFVEGGCERFRSKKIAKVWKNVFHGLDVQDWRKTAKSSLEAYQFFRNKELFPVLQDEAVSYFGKEIFFLDSADKLKAAYTRFQETEGCPWRSAPLPFDPIRLGNVPFIWETVQISQKNVDLVRMPTPTKDISSKVKDVKEVEISEEFSEYIEALRAKKERHLYVNLMDKESVHEGARSKALYAFSKKNEDVLIYLSLDKNSWFYTQTEPGLPSEKEAFFSACKRSLNSTRYTWPEGMNKKERCAIFDRAIEAIKKQYMNEMSKDERCCAIDLLHTEILHEMVQYFAPDAMNISCKNCIDRGIAQQVAFLALVNKKKGKPILPSSSSSLVFLPAHLVSNRLMQQDRFDRLVAVLDQTSSVLKGKCFR